jgi:hypothetical protein
VGTKVALPEPAAAIRGPTPVLPELAIRGITPDQLEQAIRATPLVLPVELATSHDRGGTSHAKAAPLVGSDPKEEGLVVLRSIVREGLRSPTVELQS